jgi:hypothetical protein
MSIQIPATPQALQEALELSSELVADIELSRVAPVVAALKASRLARLLNDFDHQQLFRYEAGGYPSNPDGMPPDTWRLAVLAGRTYQTKDEKTGEVKTFAYTESVDRLGEQIHTGQLALGAAADRNISVASANPSQFVFTPPGNWVERGGIQRRIAEATEQLASRRAFIYDYALRRHYELKFSGIAEDAFSHIRHVVDSRLGELVPTALQQFTAVHDNLRSENPEDWANAVHSCRRILQAVADAVFPPSSDVRVKEEPGGKKEIKLGAENYINRLVCYAEDRSASRRFSDVVGSHLRFLGDRLDAIFRAAQKGSHAAVTRDEAHRYVVYTYMIVGDILSLQSAPEPPPASTQMQRQGPAQASEPRR